MAVQGESDRNIGGYMPPAFPQTNGYDRETAILDSDSPNPSMEDMLKEATDMQTGRFNSGRLQLRSDENQSPFQQHQPTHSYQPSTNVSGTNVR